MSAVETVHGPVAAASLGPTLAHEHVFVMQLDELLVDKPRRIFASGPAGS